MKNLSTELTPSDILNLRRLSGGKFDYVTKPAGILSRDCSAGAKGMFLSACKIIGENAIVRREGATFTIFIPSNCVKVFA
jgi:hypothetical protein